MRFVVDASVAVKWLVTEEKADPDHREHENRMRLEDQTIRYATMPGFKMLNVSFRTEPE